MTDEEAMRLAIEIDGAVQKRVRLWWAELQPTERILSVFRYLVDDRGNDIVESDGKNGGVPNWLFCDGDGDKGEKPPWCAAAILYGFERAGHPIPGNKWKQRACSEMHAGFKARQQLVLRPDPPKPGDIQFYWGRRASDPIARHGIHHVGIIDVIEGETITTIEGNVSNRIGRAVHNVNHPAIAGWGRMFV